MSTEVKVGILFFSGLAIALFFTLFVSDIGTGTGVYQVRFPRITTIDAGAKVTYNGVSVGTVRRVQPVLDGGQPMVEISFDVVEEAAPSVLVGPDTKFTISQGLLGGASMDIISFGGGQPISGAALTGLIGEEPVTMSDAIKQINDLVAENRENLKSAIDKLPVAIDNISGMAGEIRGTVAENRETFGEAVTNIRDMTGTINEFVNENRKVTNDAITNVANMAEEIRGMVAENREDVRAAISAFPETIQNARSAAGNLDRILAENREDFRVLVQNLRSFSPKLDRISEDISKITSQIASGKGTLGRLVYEDTLHDKAVSAVDNFEQRLEEVEPFTAGFADLKFYAGLRGGYNMETGAGSATGYVRIEPKPWKFYEAGVGYRTAPDDRNTADEDPDDLNVDLNLTLGWRFFPIDEDQIYRVSVRGGLIEGALGGQVDVNLWSDRIWTSIMARDRHNDFAENERRFEDGHGAVVRATLNYRVWKRITVEAGFDDILDDPDPWIGMSAELLDNDLRNLASAASIAP